MDVEVIVIEHADRRVRERPRAARRLDPVVHVADDGVRDRVVAVRECDVVGLAVEEERVAGAREEDQRVHGDVAL